MLYFIKSKNYDFFLSEKDKVKNKRQINNEYIIEDISLILDTVFSFGQDGFFKTEKTILIFKRILKDINFEDIEKVINVLISANVPIIFFESEDNLKFEKYILSKDGFVIKEPEKKVFKSINSFDFTDLFLKKDKKNSWITLNSLIKKDNGSMLEIFGALFFGIKTMILIKREISQSESGINPYVFSKYSKLKSIWSEKELESIIQNILFINKDMEFDDNGFFMKLEQIIFSLN